MARWLLKTEPEEYSYDDLVAEGRGRWDGVRNPTALRHLRAMRPGDVALIYHTGKEKAIVGVAEVVSEPYPDPNAGDEGLVAVDVRARARLPRPISLTEIKADPAFADWELVRISRLSVMPVRDEHWTRLEVLGVRV